MIPEADIYALLIELGYSERIAKSSTKFIFSSTELQIEYQKNNMIIRCNGIKCVLHNPSTNRCINYVDEFMEAAFIFANYIISDHNDIEQDFNKINQTSIYNMF